MSTTTSILPSVHAAAVTREPARNDAWLDLPAAQAAFDDGRAGEASVAVERLLADNPVDPEAWLLRARILEHQGDLDAAMVASQRALALWSDITPLHEFRLRLAQRVDDQTVLFQSLRQMVAAKPDDGWLNSEMGARFSERGEFDRAVPFLRVAAPLLLHDNCSIWNYTTALAVTGRHRELLDNRPLLDRMAAQDPDVPYPPYLHLAAAQLALDQDCQNSLDALEAREASTRWLDTEPLYARLSDVAASRTPFALIRIDQVLARFVVYTSLRSNLSLRPVELSAVANSVWQDWFGEPIEASGVQRIASIGRGVASAIRDADVVGFPRAHEIRHDQINLGFMQDVLRLVLDARDASLASNDYAAALHRTMPFLRSVLHGLPFLCVVSPFPELGERLGRFCGIADARAIMLPSHGGSNQADANGSGSVIDRLLAALDRIEVPFQGAMFLVAATGPFGMMFCGRIRSLGGIALDLGAIAGSWAKR